MVYPEDVRQDHVIKINWILRVVSTVFTIEFAARFAAFIEAREAVVSCS